MAKPHKRRGISLEPRPDNTDLNHLNMQTEAAMPQAQPEAPEEPAGEAEADINDVVPELLGEIRRMNSQLGQELENQWSRQDAQLEQLEAQRQQIAEQSLQLQSLQNRKQTTARVGVLISLLALSCIIAAAAYVWPRFESLSGNLDQAIADMQRINPDVQAAQVKIGALAAEISQMDGGIAALRQQVVSINSDMGKLQKTLAALPKKQAEPVQPVKTSQPRYATQKASATRTVNNNYWNRIYRRPW